jgi:hypothetical protein
MKCGEYGPSSQTAFSYSDSVTWDSDTWDSVTMPLKLLGLYNRTFFGYNHFKSLRAWVFVTVIHFYRSLIFERKARSHLTRLHSKSRFLTFSVNIRLGWKWLTLINTPAYVNKRLESRINQNYITRVFLVTSYK